MERLGHPRTAEGEFLEPGEPLRGIPTEAAGSWDFTSDSGSFSHFFKGWMGLIHWPVEPYVTAWIPALQPSFGLARWAFPLNSMTFQPGALAMSFQLADLRLRFNIPVDTYLISGFLDWVNIDENGNEVDIDVGSGETVFDDQGRLSYLHDFDVESKTHKVVAHGVPEEELEAKDLRETQVYVYKRMPDGSLALLADTVQVRTEYTRDMQEGGSVHDARFQAKIHGKRANRSSAGGFRYGPSEIQVYPGDKLLAVAVDRAGGYVGMQEVTAPSRAETGFLDIPFFMKMYPPDIEVEVEREYKLFGISEGQKATSLIGFEGAALQSDEQIRLRTKWMYNDCSGDPPQALPRDIPPMSVRYAEINQGGNGSKLGTDDVKPGHHTLNLKLPRTAEGFPTHHLYLHVDPRGENPTFATRTSPSGPCAEGLGRPCKSAQVTPVVLKRYTVEQVGDHGLAPATIPIQTPNTCQPLEKDVVEVETVREREPVRYTPEEVGDHGTDPKIIDGKFVLNVEKHEETRVDEFGNLFVVTVVDAYILEELKEEKAKAYIVKERIKAPEMQYSIFGFDVKHLCLEADAATQQALNCEEEEGRREDIWPEGSDEKKDTIASINFSLYDFASAVMDFKDPGQVALEDIERTFVFETSDGQQHTIRVVQGTVIVDGGEGKPEIVDGIVVFGLENMIGTGEKVNPTDFQFFRLLLQGDEGNVLWEFDLPELSGRSVALEPTVEGHSDWLEASGLTLIRVEIDGELYPESDLDLRSETNADTRARIVGREDIDGEEFYRVEAEKDDAELRWGRMIVDLRNVGRYAKPGSRIVISAYDVTGSGTSAAERIGDLTIQIQNIRTQVLIGSFSGISK
ncbi:MAG: hypothetical protein HYY13_01985 [Nitrospirae bacterium]|nr:hypothetical protein [Nitrospirota bacterium]